MQVHTCAGGWMHTHFGKRRCVQYPSQVHLVFDSLNLLLSTSCLCTLQRSPEAGVLMPAQRHQQLQLSWPVGGQRRPPALPGHLRAAGRDRGHGQGQRTRSGTEDTVRDRGHGQGQRTRSGTEDTVTVCPMGQHVWHTHTQTHAHTHTLIHTCELTCQALQAACAGCSCTHSAPTCVWGLSINQVRPASERAVSTGMLVHHCSKSRACAAAPAPVLSSGMLVHHCSKSRACAAAPAPVLSSGMLVHYCSKSRACAAAPAPVLSSGMLVHYCSKSRACAAAPAPVLSLGMLVHHCSGSLTVSALARLTPDSHQNQRPTVIRINARQSSRSMPDSHQDRCLTVIRIDA